MNSLVAFGDILLSLGDLYSFVFIKALKAGYARFLRSEAFLTLQICYKLNSLKHVLAFRPYVT